MTEQEEVNKFVSNNLYLLDNPEVFVPDMNSIVKSPDNKTKVVLVGLTEYSAMIANLGFSILYNDLNYKRDDILCERAYYPETKLKKLLAKHKLPLFSKESFTPLSSFDIIGFSAYFPAQVFAIPDMLEMSHINRRSSARTDSDPIVILGGVAAFNPAPTELFVDAVFLGDGELQLETAIDMYSEMKAAGYSKVDILVAWSKHIDGVFIPRFYEEEYYPKDHPSKPNQLKEKRLTVEGLALGMPRRIKRHIADISKIVPPDRTFVGNSEGDDMSAGSIEIARGCGDKCFFCLKGDTLISTPRGSVKLKDIKAGEEVYTIKDNKVVVARSSSGATLIKEGEAFKYYNNSRFLVGDSEHAIRLDDSTYRSLDSVLTQKQNLFRSEADVFTFDVKAFLLAVIGADFSLSAGSRYPTIAQDKDRPVIQWLENNYKPNSSWIFEDRKSLRYTSGFIKDLRDRHFCTCLSPEKVIRDFSFDSFSKSASFIFGLLGTDVSLRRNERGKQIIFSSVSEALCLQYDSVLNSLGVRHTFSKKHDRFVCSISSKEDFSRIYAIVDAFKDIIPIEIERFDTSIDSIFAHKFNNTLNKKQSVGVTPLYDMHVPDTNNYIANGIVVHNCEGSYRSMPYRERPLKMITDTFHTLIRNTGVRTVTPYSFNLSDHTQVNEIIYYLVKEEGRRVSMSSQRIDRFSYQFAKSVYLSGNTSLTLGLESGSSKVRAKLSKNISDEQVLNTFKNIFLVGFRKVKVYMIADVPEETIENIMEIIPLIKKIRDLQNEIQGGIVTNISFSFTSFTAKAHTPSQWSRIRDIDPVTGLPIVHKTLSGLLDFFDTVGYKFRLSADTEFGIINQVLSLADARMSELVEKFYLSQNFIYRGGMSVGERKPTVPFQALLRGIGLDYEFFMREKDQDEVFSWDIIDMGVTKKFLHRAYWENFKNADQLSPCYSSCEKCGSCTPVSAKFFKSMWDSRMDSSSRSVALLLANEDKPEIVSRLRFEIKVKEEFRYVVQQKIKNHLRRSFMRAGLKFSNDVSLSNDKIQLQNWYHGLEYGEISLQERYDNDLGRLLIELNATLNDYDSPFIFTHVEMVSKSSNFLKSTGDILYKIDIPKSAYSFRTLSKLVTGINSEESVIIKFKQRSDKRYGFETVELNLKEYMTKLFCYERALCTRIYMLAGDKVALYDILSQLLRTSKRNILKYPCERLLVLMKEQPSDMFASTCTICGVQIEYNSFGDQISEDYCLEHLYENNDR